MGIGIMTAIIVFIIGLMSINFVIDGVTDARANLSCSDAADISDGTKLLCLVFDSTVPYWILIIVSATIGILVARMAL